MGPGPFTHKRGGKETAATQTRNQPGELSCPEPARQIFNSSEMGRGSRGRGAPAPLRALNLRLDVISLITVRRGLVFGDDGTELNSVSAQQHFQPQRANRRPCQRGVFFPRKLTPCTHIPAGWREDCPPPPLHLRETRRNGVALPRPPYQREPCCCVTFDIEVCPLAAARGAGVDRSWAFAFRYTHGWI